MQFYKKFNLYLCMFFYSLSGLVQANTLGIDEFIIKVLEFNPGVQRILADEAIATARLKSSYGIDDSVLSSSLSLSHLEPDLLTGREATNMDKRNLSLSLDRKFSNTGTQLSLSYQNYYTEQQPAAIVAGNNYYQPSLTLQLTQPLLRNSGGIQDRLNIRLDKLGLELTQLSVREELESYITQLARLYMDWYLSHKEMTILKDVYEQVVEQEKVVRRKVNRQVAESYELLRIREIKQDYYSRWQQSIGKYKGLTHQISQQITINNNAPDISPVDMDSSKITNAEKIIVRKNNYLTDISRIKKILDLLRAQQTELLNVRKNSEDPELNLIMGYTKHGIGENNVFAEDKDDYSVMLQYRQALGNRTAEGKYEEQIANVRKIEADSQQRLIDASSNLNNFIEQLKKLKVSVAASAKKIQLADRKLKQEYRLYKIGRLDQFQLLQDQTSQLESRINQVQLKIQLLKMKLNIGELLDQNLEIFSVRKTAGK